MHTYDISLNLPFSLFLNTPETNPLYISPRCRRGENPVERLQEFWMRRLFSRFLADQSGATAIEYCLIAAGLSIVIVVAVSGIGATLNTKVTAINSSLK